MVKQVVIHVGPGKTGTSAIQYWLNSNRKLLAGDGVWYPKHTYDVNNVSTGNRNTIFEFDKNSKQILSHSKIKFLLSKFEKSEYKLLLLSSEFFFIHMEELIKSIPNVKFIAYLRNPLELIESNYNQGVKRKQTIKPLYVSETLQFKTINHISRLLDNTPSLNISIRPYDKNLFVGGNIINDLLSIIDIQAQNIDNKVVNSSYSLQALEFKRMANHFKLGRVDVKLDRVLQGYRQGDINYSLIPPERFNHLKSSLLSQLDIFISRHKLDNLKCFRESVAQSAQRTVKQQHITAKEIARVGNYIQQTDSKLFDTLKKLAVWQNKFILPNHAYYNFFEVQCPPRIDVKSFRSLNDLSVKLNLGRDKHIDMLREVAFSLADTGHEDIALLYLEAAHKLAPNRPIIRNEINEYYNKDYIVESPSKVKSRSLLECLKVWFFNFSR